MVEKERRLLEGARHGSLPRRVSAPEHPLILLQRAAGNAAVSRLVAGMTVQRIWPFDDEDAGEDAEGEGEEEETPDEAPEEGGEEGVPKNPSEQIPNAPTEAPIPNPDAVVQWRAWAYPGDFAVVHGTFPGAMIEASRDRVMEWASSLPSRPIPDWEREGGELLVFSTAREVLPVPPDPVGEQAFRKWAGLPSPEVDRIVSGEGGGTRPAPGGGGTPGGAGPGGIPGGIPGLEPVPPGGGGGAGPGGIPGLEPVPPSGGGGAGQAPTGARPMLRRGSTGDAVRDAQGLLVRHGATLTPDGQFGALTQRAVINFQRNAGLGPDGIIGPLTWRALESG